MDEAPNTDDLDLGAVSTRDALARLLQTVRVRADKPSLRMLESRTRHTPSPLSKTAVAEMLKGVRLPRKTMMVSFLKACGVKDDDMESWRRAWDRVADGEKEAARSGIVSTAPEMDSISPAPGGPAGIEKANYLAGDHPAEVFAVSPAGMQAFGTELTKTLRLRRKTPEQAAAAVAVPLAEIAQWVAGQGLPSESQARLLDDYLRARGVIQDLVTGLRARPDSPEPRFASVPLPRPSAPTLLQVFQNVADALRGCLVRDTNLNESGWLSAVTVRAGAGF